MNSLLYYLRLTVSVAALVAVSLVYGWAFAGVPFGYYGGVLLALCLSTGTCLWLRDKNWKAKLATSIALAAFLVLLISLTRFRGEYGELVRPDGSVESEAVRRLYEGLAFAAVFVVSSFLMPPSARARKREPETLEAE